MPDQRHRRRHDHSSGCALHHPGRDQRADRRRQPARGRREGEQPDAGAECAAGAGAVRERPRGQQQRREQQRVAVDHPLQPGDTATEVRTDRGQGDVDDDRVQRDHKEPQHRRRQRRDGMA